jgi:dephospho-CoA kinase
MTIGIAGGIGAGKSVVTDYLRGKGYEVIDADEVAREAVAPGEPALASLVTAFGADILTGDGALDRARLASLAFADDAKARLLNETMHRDIGGRIADKLRECGVSGHGRGAMKGDVAFPSESRQEGQQSNQSGIPVEGGVVFLSAPLLFESGLDRVCDEVWLVTAPEDVRIDRAVSRGGLTRDEARARATRQMSEEDRRARADAVIENTGDKNALYRAVDKLLAERVLRDGE